MSKLREALARLMAGFDEDWMSEDGWCLAGCGFLLDRPEKAHAADCPLVQAKALLEEVPQ